MTNSATSSNVTLKIPDDNRMVQHDCQSVAPDNNKGKNVSRNLPTLANENNKYAANKISS